MVYKQCVICGKSFEGKKNQKYCKECGEKVRREVVVRYRIVCEIRKTMWRFLEDGLKDYPRRVLNKMIEEDGEEFAEDVLGEKLIREIRKP